MCSKYVLHYKFEVCFEIKRTLPLQPKDCIWCKQRPSTSKKNFQPFSPLLAFLLLTRRRQGVCGAFQHFRGANRREKSRGSLMANDAKLIAWSLNLSRLKLLKSKWPFKRLSLGQARQGHSQPNDGIL